MTNNLARPSQVHWFETFALMNLALTIFESAAKGDGWSAIAIVTLLIVLLALAIARWRSHVAFWVYTAIVSAVFGVVALGLVHLTATTGAPRFSLTAILLSLVNVSLNVAALALLWSKPSRNWLRQPG